MRTIKTQLEKQDTTPMVTNKEQFELWGKGIKGTAWWLRINSYGVRALSVITFNHVSDDIEADVKLHGGVRGCGTQVANNGDNVRERNYYDITREEAQKHLESFRKRAKSRGLTNLGGFTRDI